MNSKMTKAQISAENEMLRAQLEVLRNENLGLDAALFRANEVIDELRAKREAAPTPKALLQSAREYALTNHVLTRVHNGVVQSHHNGVWRNV